jgi:phosphonate transport system permease protein
LRGINSFAFALIFVVAVGLGPFAGVLGVALHMAGSIAKLWSESIEAVEPGPPEAVMAILCTLHQPQLPRALPTACCP